MFGLFEINGGARKVRVGEAEFVSIEAGLLSFAEVIEWEFSDDGMACDLAVNVRGSLAVYSIEAL